MPSHGTVGLQRVGTHIVEARGEFGVFFLEIEEMKIAAILGVAGLAAVASAQLVTITVSSSDNEVAIGETATVTVTASFTGAAGFAGYWFDLVDSGTGAGGASDGAFLNNLGALAPPPTVSGGGYDNLQSANFPIALGGNASNPIAIFTYTFTGTAAGVVDLTTATNPGSAAPAAQVYLTSGSFAATPATTEVVGTSITVTPTPASAALLGLGGLAAARRRR